ncbi:hypothetical protein THRCLA_22156 [Thraustotheca clavata]|uniref:Uncharacterized protein n=1 Tax=Thraustotheca clavata TaxID=74557 RepID=A0A1V9ZBH4_9STRA|nr:hypothetical protein THRCLA_22156 [Thraustotheca clavata]
MLSRTGGQWLGRVISSHRLCNRLLHSTQLVLSVQEESSCISGSFTSDDEKFDYAQQLIATHHDAHQASQIIKCFATPPTIQRAMALVALMHENDIPLSNTSTTSKFTKVYFRAHVHDIPSAFTWYFNHHQALLSSSQVFPLENTLIHLVTQGFPNAAVQILFLSIDSLGSQVPTQAIDALVRELIRFEQFNSILSMHTSKHKQVLLENEYFVVAVMESFVQLSKYQEAIAFHHTLEKIPSRKRYNDLYVLATKKYQKRTLGKQ